MVRVQLYHALVHSSSKMSEASLRRTCTWSTKCRRQYSLLLQHIEGRRVEPTSSHTLQCNPVLEPNNTVSTVTGSKCLVQSSREGLVDEVFNQSSRLGRDITGLRIRSNGCLQPNAYVRDSWRQAIWPVVLQDSEVILIRERGRVPELESWWLLRRRFGG